MQRSHLYQRFYQSLLDRILSGDLRQGELFPTIQEISQKYGIAVNTVRAAFTMLQKEGFIQSVKKKGTMVIRDCLEPDEMSEFLLHRRDTYLQVSEMFPILVPDMVELGARHCGERELAQMNSLLHRASNEQTNLREHFLIWRDFLNCLLSPTQNRQFMRLMEAAHDFVCYPLLSVPDIAMEAEKLSAYILQEMQNITGALGRGDRLGVWEEVGQIYEMGHRYLVKALNTLPPEETSAERADFFWIIDKSTHLLYSTIAGKLLQRIMLGYYPYGSYLSSQTKLQEEFGASLSSVRSGLSCLTEMDILQYHNGRGYMVESVNELPDMVEEQLAFFGEAWESIQILGVTGQSLAEAAYPNLREADIRFFKQTDAALFGKPEGRFYSPAYLLMMLIVERQSNSVIRQILGQITRGVAYGCQFLQVLERNFPGSIEKAHHLAVCVVQALEEQDRERFLLEAGRLFGICLELPNLMEQLKKRQ